MRRSSPGGGAEPRQVAHEHSRILEDRSEGSALVSVAAGATSLSLYTDDPWHHHGVDEYGTRLELAIARYAHRAVPPYQRLLEAAGAMDA